jgi:hypothetical protein
VIRRTLIAAGLAAPPIVVAILVVVAGSSGGVGAAASSAAGTGTALVDRRTLAEKLTVSGTIGYAGESTALARLSGTITWLPRVGDVVRRGETLFGVSGEPVVLMYGGVPAYRELAEGVSAGKDVRQLEENLAALGFEPGTVDLQFTSSTAAAVSAWQEELGREATGAVELGRVAFLPGPRRVTKIEATLGEAIGSGGGAAKSSAAAKASTTVPVTYQPPGVGQGVEAPGAAPESPQEAPQGEEGTPPAGVGGQEDGGTREGPGESRPGSVTPRAPLASPEHEPAGGGGSEVSSVAILETTSTRRIVSVELEPDQQSIARRGQLVDVILPDGGEAKGRVQRLVATEQSGEEGVKGESEAEAGIDVTVAMTGRKRVPSLDGATVSVVFTLRVRRDVLTVPLTALLAIGGARFAVVVEEGSRRRRIEVNPKLAADGYVEVEGDGLRRGMRVETAE